MEQPPSTPSKIKPQHQTQLLQKPTKRKGKKKHNKQIKHLMKKFSQQ
jgi:hypothetical protein